MIELVGDLGSGKTTLVQGVLAGLGFRGEVPSPTFTLERVYPVLQNRKAYHLDFYRLDGSDIVTEELAEIMGDPQNIVMVEWAGNGKVQLPPGRIRIDLRAEAKENERRVTVQSLGGAGMNVIKGLQNVYCA